MLLIGPAMAVGMFIIKMFVAAGFWVSNQFALLPHDGTRPGVAVYARAERPEEADQTARHDQLLVRLSSGETFRGDLVAADALDAAVDTPDWGAIWAAAEAVAPTGDSAGPPPLLATLTSESGQSMVCSLYGAPGHPIGGTCLTAKGARFDLRL